MKLNSYANAYRQNSVNTASPGRLILMLFDGALRFMTTALQGFDNPDVIARNETIHNHLMKTQAIIDELHNSLDPSFGEFPQRMSALYDYMRRQLTLANRDKTSGPIVVVMGLLREIRDAWAIITEQMEISAETPTHEFVATAA